MARENRKKLSFQFRPEYLLIVVFIIPAVLITLGDSIRFLISGFFRLITIPYNVSFFLLLETLIAIKNWASEKQKNRSLPRLAARISRSANAASITAKQMVSTKITSALQGAKQIANTIAKSAARVYTKIKSTRLHKPVISLPNISLPKGLLPSQNLRLFRIPAISLPILKPVQKSGSPAISSDQLQVPSAWNTNIHRMETFAAGVVAAIMFLFIPYVTMQWLQALPNPQLLTRRDLEVTTKIYDRNDALLYEIYADQNRTPLALDEIPNYVKQATVAIEDREFYHHNGISVRGILRAAKETLFNQRLQGGSTITQQLIKSALLTPEVKITRKIKEIVLAFWAERMYSKNQILEMYLNQVPYGGTAWGVEAASQTYYGKSVKELSLAEAALLAGLPAAPTEYSPFGSHPEFAFVRQKEVLRRMVEERYITRAQADTATAEKIQFAQPHTAIRAPHFVMYVKNLLEQRYGPRLVERGGLRIKTSLDITMQEKVEDIVKTHIDSLQYLRVGNGAALVTNPKTGEILAMVGSRDYFDLERDGNVNVTTSMRQPGSSIKVVTYASALENGYTAGTILDDTPVVYQITGSTPYAPVNYDGRFHGPTPLRYALGNSYNIPPVRILNKIGLPTMMETAKRMGIDSWKNPDNYGLSLTLGGGDVTMLEMAKVFGTLANNGTREELLPILEVTDYTGKIIEKNTPKKGLQAIKPETAWIMSNILSDNNARMAAFGPISSLVIPGKTVAVKTGTTNEKRDNWTVGYTPSFVTAVWVGNNDNSPMDPFLTSGVTGAAPIWHDIMMELLKDKTDEVAAKPDNIVGIPCYFGRIEYFVAGSEPRGGRCAPPPTPFPSPTPTGR